MTPNRSARELAVLAFASLAPLAMAYLGFVALANEVDRGRSALATVYSIGKIVQFGVPFLYVWLYERGEYRTLSLAPRGVLLGIAFGLAVDAAMAIVYFGALRDSGWFVDASERIVGKLQELRLATPAGYLGIGLFFSVVHSLLEEAYWRWFVFGWMRRFVPFAWAVGLSSVAFMAHHVVVLAVYFPWALAIPLSLGVAVGGAVWCWMYARSGSLLGPWLGHMAIDAGIMIVGYDMVRGTWG